MEVSGHMGLQATAGSAISGVLKNGDALYGVTAGSTVLVHRLRTRS